jgi:cyclopropane fatty-acyl-phospholipid synthase-like methyltransferase
LRGPSTGEPGGIVSVVNEDLFAYEPERQFDAIFSIRAYQGFPRPHQEELARRFHRWLRPGGIAVVLMINVDRGRAAQEQPFLDAGFRVTRQRGGLQPEFARWVTFVHGSG